jgi:hypothetical protein
MDVITKVWIYYDQLDASLTMSRSTPEDGIGFEGEGFSGTISLPPPGHGLGIISVYSKGHYWGHEERLLKVRRITAKIEDSLFDRCIK